MSDDAGSDRPGSPLEIGGEMPFWSEDRSAGGIAVVDLVRALVPAASHVLVAGPHAPDVLRAAADGPHALTVLTRGTPDAQAALDLLEPGRATAWAGDLARVPEEPAFDLVVAAGGLEVLASADAGPRPWRELLDLVASRLTASGRLVVGVTNDVAVEVLAGAPTRQRDDSAGSWLPDSGYDDTRPTTPAELADALTGALPSSGTTAPRVDTWAVFPGLAAADLVVPTDERPRGRTLLTARIASSVRRGLADPTGLATRLPVSGQAVTLAPALLALAGGDGTAAPVLGPPAEDAARAGASVELALLDACLGFDLPRVRAVVERYAQVLGTGTTDGTTAADLPVDVFLADDGDVVRLRPVEVATGDGDAGDALLRGLDAVARRLSRLGWRHPWPVTYDDVDVTRALLAGVGRDVDRDTVLRSRDDGTGEDPVGEEPATDPGRLARENDGLRAQVEWFETTLRRRDRQLTAATADLALVADADQRTANREDARPVPPPPPANAAQRARRLAGLARRRVVNR